MKRAALYIRVSTEEQAKDGFSIAAQREKLSWYASSQDWLIVDHYIDEGYSAKDLDRPALQRMLHDIRRQKIDIVLVYRLDRLTRSVLDLYQLLEEWERVQVSFRSCTEVYDTTTAIGRLFITLVAALAQWERENLAERVKLGMEQMALEEKRPGGPPPYGYRLHEGSLRINPQEAEVVRKIFSLHEIGKSLSDIAQVLNDQQLPSRTGARWSATTLSHMLQNHVYYGALRWNYAEGGQKKNSPDTWIIREGTHPPIIDKMTFLTAQRLLEARRQQHGRALASDFLFAGKVICARCGELMYGKTIRTKKKEGEYYLNRYYLCKKQRQKECNAPAIRETALEELFLSHASRLSAPASLIQRIYYEENGIALPKNLEMLLRDIPRLWSYADVMEKKQWIAVLVQRLVVSGRPLTIHRLEFL
ncbi:recombinase family protein [Brevibacillus migulae]|uniref:recombinase family protein n=1 Tax=Brevibacillus migulae TaxID=1644114 RepID=UPI00106E5B0E|nr:recombinase family protein [Brevibacillus migulae]